MDVVTNVSITVVTGLVAAKDENEAVQAGSLPKLTNDEQAARDHTLPSVKLVVEQIKGRFCARFQVCAAPEVVVVELWPTSTKDKMSWVINVVGPTKTTPS